MKENYFTAFLDYCQLLKKFKKNILNGQLPMKKFQQNKSVFFLKWQWRLLGLSSCNAFLNGSERAVSGIAGLI